MCSALIDSEPVLTSLVRASTSVLIALQTYPNVDLQKVSFVSLPLTEIVIFVLLLARYAFIAAAKTVDERTAPPSTVISCSRFGKGMVGLHVRESKYVSFKFGRLR